MPAQEALPLLDELLEHAIQEKFQYRHRWKAGDLVIWDNRRLMHKAQRLPGQQSAVSVSGHAKGRSTGLNREDC
jgi:alpha-ketoglutarate-dependent taurine dioxygenase